MRAREWWDRLCVGIACQSRVAQWKRAGPITQRSVDRNHALLTLFQFFNNRWRHGYHCDVIALVRVDEWVDSIIISIYSPAVSASRGHRFVLGSYPGGGCIFCPNLARTGTGRATASATVSPSGHTWNWNGLKFWVLSHWAMWSLTKGNGRLVRAKLYECQFSRWDGGCCIKEYSFLCVSHRFNSRSLWFQRKKSKSIPSSRIRTSDLRITETSTVLRSTNWAIEG